VKRFPPRTYNKYTRSKIKHVEQAINSATAKTTDYLKLFGGHVIAMSIDPLKLNLVKYIIIKHIIIKVINYIIST